MRAFALAGLLLFVVGAYLLVARRAPTEKGPKAALWMQGFSLELSAYAESHEGRFPLDLADLRLDLAASGFATHAVDPWGTPYRYERHPEDPGQCRVYTYGDPKLAGERGGNGAIALYRDREKEHWRRDLDDVPRAWTDALPIDALAD